MGDRRGSSDRKPAEKERERDGGEGEGKKGKAEISARRKGFESCVTLRLQPAVAIFLGVLRERHRGRLNARKEK